MPTLSTMPGSAPTTLFVSGRDLPGSMIPLRKLDVNSPTLRSALDIGESYFASVEKFFELYGLQTLGDGDFQQVVERLAENNGKDKHNEQTTTETPQTGFDIPGVIIIVDEPDTTLQTGSFEPQNIDLARIDAMVADGLARKIIYDGEEYVYFADIPDGQNVQLFLLKKTRSWWQYSTGQEWHYEVVKSTVAPIGDGAGTHQQIYKNNNSEESANLYLSGYLSDVAAGKQYVLNGLTFALHLVPLGAGIDHTLEGNYGEAGLAFTGDAAMFLSFGASKLIQGGAKGIEVATAAEKAAAVAQASQSAKYATWFNRGAMTLEGGLVGYNLCDAATAENGWDAAGHLGEATLRLFGVTANFIAHAKTSGTLRQLVNAFDSIPKAQIVNTSEVIQKCLKDLESVIGTSDSSGKLFAEAFLNYDGYNIPDSVLATIKQIAADPSHALYKSAKTLCLGIDTKPGGTATFIWKEMNAALHFDELLKRKGLNIHLERNSVHEGADAQYVFKTMDGDVEKIIRYDFKTPFGNQDGVIDSIVGKLKDLTANYRSGQTLDTGIIIHITDKMTPQQTQELFAAINQGIKDKLIEPKIFCTMSNSTIKPGAVLNP